MDILAWKFQGDANHSLKCEKINGATREISGRRKAGEPPEQVTGEQVSRRAERLMGKGGGRKAEG
jgi:hypothetical protein